ncbi:hypothetical protein Droror1_Dr00006100 [Drosera rotundifolia]
MLEVRGPDIVDELKYFVRGDYMHFSKKPFSVFLECTSFSKADVLLQEHKAGSVVLRVHGALVMLTNVWYCAVELINGVGLCLVDFDWCRAVGGSNSFELRLKSGVAGRLENWVVVGDCPVRVLILW